ncbi:hypothetical protein GCM10011309_15780 [Litorimonas cladophorae]|uniref:Uncharacterized protein n=1 Tax=Litorimonas cladophorae TaxID=1220491 RepID=A0A918NFP5_9PROT|nr:hypothetical protein [Litorimonas cladophorae]GGX66996.1 hypothetical protein GCM10011309_15780 [Litorimonas cladophorae]
MKAILPLCLLVYVPQISFAQINSMSPPVCDLTPNKRVIAEVVSVERHAEGDVKYSLLQIDSVFGIGEFRATTEPKTMKVRHAHRDFELFEGQHVLDLKRTHCRGEWYLERSSHGEIVNIAERTRRTEIQKLKEESFQCNWPVERELCYQKINMAYHAEIFVGSFQLDNAEVCEQYIPQYNTEFRYSPRP